MSAAKRTKKKKAAALPAAIPLRTQMELELVRALVNYTNLVKAFALLADCRDVLRQVVKLGPKVPTPKAERQVGLELVPLELLQAAGDLLIPLNELLARAQR